jgi:hypothetical protein
MFAATFPAATAPAPFHNSTCDGCHVRNGSGIPINTQGTLDPALQEFMSGGVYTPYAVKDYTFTGQIRPMKLVFFDLQRDDFITVTADKALRPKMRDRHSCNDPHGTEVLDSLDGAEHRPT